jgi:hypothetical protein
MFLLFSSMRHHIHQMINPTLYVTVILSWIWRSLVMVWKLIMNFARHRLKILLHLCVFMWPPHTLPLIPMSFSNYATFMFVMLTSRFFMSLLLFAMTWFFLVIRFGFYLHDLYVWVVVATWFFFMMFLNYFVAYFSDLAMGIGWG